MASRAADRASRRPWSSARNRCTEPSPALNAFSPSNTACP